MAHQAPFKIISFCGYILEQNLTVGKWLQRILVFCGLLDIKVD